MQIGFIQLPTLIILGTLQLHLKSIIVNNTHISILKY